VVVAEEVTTLKLSKMVEALEAVALDFQMNKVH
jgi:hypothetical protein